MTISLRLEPRPDTCQRGIRTRLVISPRLLSSLVVTVDVQPLVSSLSFFIGRVVMITLLTLGRDKLFQENCS